MKRCSTSPIIREMQLKTTMRHHLIPIRKVSIKISTNHKCWRGYGKQGTILHCWWRCKCYNHYREQYEVSLLKKKKTNRVIRWSSNPTSGHIPRENHNLKRYIHHNVYYSTIYNSQDMEASKMSIDKGMDKEDVIHVYNGILVSY